MKHILVGIDGSPESLAAVSVAAGLAASLHASVMLVSVFDAQPAAMSAGEYVVPDDWMSQWREEVTGKLAGEWSAPLRDAGVPMETRVAEGRAADVLIELARSSAVDLIVVGSRGRGTFRETLFGSVSHRLVLHAPCPVVVVPTAVSHSPERASAAGAGRTS